MERAYTVSEIDDLRNALRNKHLWGFYAGPRHNLVETDRGVYSSNVLSRPFGEPDMRGVEDRVRTHMLVGHTAEDLLASEVFIPAVEEVG